MIFYTNGLLSKWGFSDGDILFDFAYDNGFTKKNEHQALARIVREHIVPKLDQAVEIWELGTHHNPIRASHVDGKDVGAWHYDPKAPDLLTPATIEVPDEIIKTILSECDDE